VNAGEGRLELRDLTKAYDEVVAVDRLALTIEPGEFFSLLGASGCGKTTTLRLVAGFEVPDQGHVLLDGADLTAVPPHRRPVNTVFQSYALFPFLDVFDNVAFGLRYQRATKQETRDRVGAALDLVEMTDFAKRRPHQLSGGQQQRVALARALVLEPTVLLLDEPLGALDAKLRRQLQVDLRLLQKRVGTTFVYVTHDQEEALTMSDRLAILVDGRVEQQGTPSQMYARPASAYVAGFLGASNLLEARVREVADGEARCEVDGVLLVADATRGVTAGDEVTLVVRPERVEVLPASEAGVRTGPAGGNSLSGRVRSLVFRGGHTHVIARAAGCQLTAEVANVHGALPSWLSEGGEVCLRISSSAVQILPDRSAATPPGRSLGGPAPVRDDASASAPSADPAPGSRSPSRS
jgi:spermidine/putrescine transport system ATP-binding protein